MPGEVEADKEEEKAEESTAAPEATAPAPPRPVVGIIYPPPEVRNIVDKTADFVARNGPEFAERIKQNEAGNAKFNFLSPSDPYHAYYLHKINEIQEAVLAPQQAQQQQQASSSAPPPVGVAPPGLVVEPEVPLEPPSEWEYLTDPPSILSLIHI